MASATSGPKGLLSDRHRRSFRWLNERETRPKSHETLMGGIERETQTAGTYDDFTAPVFAPQVDLSEESLDGLSSRGIQTMIAAAYEEMERYQILIFGRSDDQKDDGTAATSVEELNGELKERFAAVEASWTHAAGYDRTRENEESGEEEYLHHDTEGLFNFHVGYAPVMKSDDPERVQEAGYGEMGRIMEDFYRNEARLGRGLAMMDVPFHRMRMWDDDADNDGSPDGLFGAPNIVTVTGVVVSVATLGAGAGVSLAATIATNAAFTVTDIATGYADADDALGSFAKSTAVSLASAGMAKGFDQLGTLAGKAVDGSRAITQTAVNVGMSTTQAVATTAMSSAINSFSIDASFDMDFDERGFRRSTFGESAVAGYAGGAAQGLAQSGFGSLAKMDDLAGFSREHMGAVNSLVSLGANAVGAAVDYAVDREVAINVLNVGRMLGIEDEKGNALSAGALEMNLGGDGALFNVGSGGYDIGVDLVANGMMGANVLHQRARIDRYIEENAHNAAAENTLRATWSFGKREERSTYGNILEGVDRLHLTGAPGSEGARAQTIAGGNGKDIYLGAIGDSLEEQLVAASVLSHESYRDGIADGDNAETVSAVTGHTEFAMRAAETYGMGFIMNDANLAEDVNQYLKAQAGQGDFAAYATQAYRSDQDFWALVQDENGEWGWQEDGNLDFDLSALSPDKRAAVEEALRRNGSGLTEDGRVRHEDMDETIIDLVADAVTDAPATEPGVFRMGPDTSRHADTLLRFRSGTEKFADVSRIADNLMRNGVTDAGISTLDQALVAAQSSGLLIQNDANVGPFDPSDPIIYPGEGDHTLLTSPQGHRFRLNRHGEPTNRYHEGADFAVYREDGSRYTGGEVGVRSREESHVELQDDPIFGLQTISTGATVQGQYSHLHGNTIMDYLGVFGTRGVTATGRGLSGVPAGMRIGSIGNTGAESTGPHLDFITNVLVDPIENTWATQDPTITYPTLSTHPETSWSKIFGGHETNRMMPNTIIDLYRQNGNDIHSLIPWMDDQFVTPEASDWAMELIMRNIHNLWQS